MAEKEERTKDIIYVFSQELICKDCKDWYEHIDPLDKLDCDNCEDIADLPHISRQEAINRMAKALIRADYPNAQESIWAMRWQNPASKDYYLIMANAALNALLEDVE